MTGRGVHGSATVVFSIAMLAIGVALIAQALAGSEGLVSARTLLGALFLAAGGGRLYIQLRRRPGA